MLFRKRGGAARESAKSEGWLSRLRRDTRGNTLAIIGAALVPLAGMIGSGVDMSRAYMAKTRLQSACDAAALAGRRVMQNDTMNETVEDEAERFFNFNFRQGLYSTDPFTPVVTRPVSGTVRVTASTTIPTSIMKIFGFTSLPLNVTCDASLNFVNTDIMLVLDVTTSMADPIGGTQKIVSLREAVMSLYRELAPIQAQLQTAGLRLRYGIVPYSSSVNVGNLIRARNIDFLRSSAPYQTREAYYNTRVSIDTPIVTADAGLAVNPGAQRFRITGTDRLISNANCASFGSNTSFSQTVSGSTGGAFTATGNLSGDADIYDPDGAAGLQASAPAAPTGYVRYQFSRNTAAWSASPWDRVCDRNVTVTRRTYRYSFTSWIYRQQTIDTADLRNGSTTVASDPQFHGGTVATAGYYTDRALVDAAEGETTTTLNWNGCIEERDTAIPSLITGTTPANLALPATASDLNINLIPSTDQTRWRLHWPAAVYRRGNNDSTTDPNAVTYMGTQQALNIACPAEARRLDAMTEAQMQTYVNGLQPVGSTYHDIGMLWGARMLSSGGIFADSPDTFGGMPVARHIIFMTDGIMQPWCELYTAYGIERNDKRVTGSYNCTDQEERHTQRFKMICNAARGMNMSIWVIAFGSALQDHLTSCASSPSQASVASNQAQLVARFREIGNNIGALRLTQ